MTNKELKQKFPIGKLYQINFGNASNLFEAYVNDNCLVKMPTSQT